MNITTPFPSSLATPTSNINTEAARRENVLRETIPQASESDKGPNSQGSGADSDRARQSSGAQVPATYERPGVAESQLAESSTTQQESKDNGSDQSAGRESAEQRQKEQTEALEVTELKKRDQEVRIHEEAHRATGGQYASAPQYEYTTGPDNKRYVTGGEVSIDVSEAETPAKTVQKMEQVIKAALAPAEPSAQDRKVASEAAQTIARARGELNSEQINPATEDDPTLMDERIERIQLAYREAYTPRDAGFRASA